jgi:hypothetical protein
MKITETDDHIFINDTDLSAYIVPKRAFKTKKEMKRFKKLLKDYLE